MEHKIKNIKISNYSYDLPDSRIAKYPLSNRDESKLLYIENQEIKHTRFKHLADLLQKDDLLVFNNAKVIQARLNFRKETGAKIEIFCLEPYEPADYNLAFQAKEKCQWKCMVGNLKKWKSGNLNKDIKIDNINYILSARKTGELDGSVIIEFSWNAENSISKKISFGDILDSAGKTPLPPYLNRAAEAVDKTTYQTVYAKQEGSVAAPTAGLHFTDKVFSELNNKGIACYELTLHVGAGTFRPVKSDTIGAHSMHEEHFRVEKSFLENIIRHKGRRIAVGTTSVRTLESLYYLGVKIHQGFDFSKEKFEIPAMEFIELYHEGLKTTNLHKYVVDVLKYFDSMGLEQYILSAMEHNSLLKSLSDNNIKDYFIDVNGIDNHFAHSKLEIGKSMLKNISHKNEDLLLIGDTLHDKDVADGLGIQHLLIANGHQSKKRLLDETEYVVDSISEVLNLFRDYTNFNTKLPT
ncbi:MAG: S-adenosylmethionine:tRNA ribosyltransferase-isomerase [Bacteroidales bacterium]|nr:S-adenosylmethionine:tRNA ribosyltransferase-isomerase [Bacteroidales bacterium]